MHDWFPFLPKSAVSDWWLDTRAQCSSVCSVSVTANIFVTLGRVGREGGQGRGFHLWGHLAFPASSALYSYWGEWRQGGREGAEFREGALFLTAFFFFLLFPLASRSSLWRGLWLRGVGPRLGELRLAQGWILQWADSNLGWTIGLVQLPEKLDWIHWFRSSGRCSSVILWSIF